MVITWKRYKAGSVKERFYSKEFKQIMDLAFSNDKSKSRAYAPAVRRLLAECSKFGGLVNALYPRAKLRQFSLDIFVATIQMINALDRGFTGRDKARNDQTRGGPQVGRHHRRAL